MFSKILVALDHSTVSSKLFKQALSLAETLGAHLMLLHVLSDADADSPHLPLQMVVDTYPIVLEEPMWQTYSQQREAYEQRGLEQLKRYAEEATAHGVPTEFSQLLGSSGQTICDLAKNWPADLILVGNRGRRGLAELLLGSVSNYVMHHAPCSVLVVHMDALTAASEQAIVTEKNVPQTSSVR